MKQKKELKNRKINNFGIFFHQNLGLHLLISFIVNLVICVSLIGIYSLIEYDIFSFTLLGFILYIAIFTLLESMATIFIFRHFMKILLKTKGLIVVLIYGLIFYLTTLVADEVSFVYPKILKIIVYTISFLFLRLIFIIIYQRYQLNEKQEEK